MQATHRLYTLVCSQSDATGHARSAISIAVRARLHAPLQISGATTNSATIGDVKHTSVVKFIDSDVVWLLGLDADHAPRACVLNGSMRPGIVHSKCRHASVFRRDLCFLKSSSRTCFRRRSLRWCFGMQRSINCSMLCCEAHWQRRPSLNRVLRLQTERQTEYGLLCGTRRRPRLLSVARPCRRMIHRKLHSTSEVWSSKPTPRHPCQLEPKWLRIERVRFAAMIQKIMLLMTR